MWSWYRKHTRAQILKLNGVQNSCYPPLVHIKEYLKVCWWPRDIDTGHVVQLLHAVEEIVYITMF